MAGHLEYLVAQGSGTRRYVTLDATKTHFTDGWHETRVGAVYDVTQNHRGEDTPALTTYVAGVREPVGEFAERLYQEYRPQPLAESLRTELARVLAAAEADLHV